MQSRKYRWLLGLVGIHLTLCLLGALSFSYRRLGKAGHVLSYYGELTGANSNFGFFAPGVYGQLRARFDVTDAAGRTVKGALANSDLSHEAKLRVGNIIDQFQEIDDVADDEATDDADFEKRSHDLTRALAASLAGKIFARYPQASRVTVHLDNFETISMADYRRGVRPQWKPLYEVTFAPKLRASRLTEVSR